MADINRQKLLELAASLGLGPIDRNKLRTVEDAAKKYENKSEEEVLKELKQLKETLFADKESFERQMKLVKDIRPMLNEDQRQKLDRVIDLLSRE